MSRDSVETRNQDCAEQMIYKAAELVLGQKIHINYDGAPTHDNQIDLFTAFATMPIKTSLIWHNGNDAELFETALAQLTQREYFLRTGRNNGAGHWQVLYFNHIVNDWFIYSSEINQYRLTENNHLTDEGKNKLLAIHGKWGTNNGEYAFSLIPIAREHIYRATVFTYTTRIEGEYSAIAKVMDEQLNFADEFQNITIAGPVQQRTSRHNHIDDPIASHITRVIARIKDSGVNPIVCNEFTQRLESIYQDFNTRNDTSYEQTLINIHNISNELQDYIAYERQISNFINSIVANLTTNINERNNGRWKFFTYGVAEKSVALQEVLSNFNQHNINDEEALTSIREICQRKRNKYSCFAPHSLREFENFMENRPQLENFKEEQTHTLL